MSRPLLATALIALAGAPVERAAAAESPPISTLSVVDSKPDPTWELDSAVWGQRFSFPEPSTEATATSEGIDLTVVQFLSPVRDDGAPYALRPFLQRTGRLSVTVGASHFSEGGTSGISGSGGNVAAGVDNYFKPWLAVVANVGYGRSWVHGALPRQESESASVGAAVRTGDVRLEMAYAVARNGVDGTWSALQRSFLLSLTGVVARKVRIDLSGRRPDDGNQASLDVEYFPSVAVGVFAGGSLSRTHPSAAVEMNDYGTDIGFEGWFDQSKGLIARYDRSVASASLQGVVGSGGEIDQTSHMVSLQFDYRFR